MADDGKQTSRQAPARVDIFGHTTLPFSGCTASFVYGDERRIVDDAVFDQERKLLVGNDRTRGACRSFSLGRIHEIVLVAEGSGKTGGV